MKDKRIFLIAGLTLIPSIFIFFSLLNKDLNGITYMSAVLRVFILTLIGGAVIASFVYGFNLWYFNKRTLIKSLLIGFIAVNILPLIINLTIELFNGQSKGYETETFIENGVTKTITKEYYLGQDILERKTIKEVDSLKNIQIITVEYDEEGNVKDSTISK